MTVGHKCKLGGDVVDILGDHGGQWVHLQLVVVGKCMVILNWVIVVIGYGCK